MLVCLADGCTPPGVIKYVVRGGGGGLLTQHQVFSLLANDDDGDDDNDNDNSNYKLRESFRTTLAQDVPFDFYFWECRPISQSSSSSSSSFECCVVDAHVFPFSSSSPSAFAGNFTPASTSRFATFSNLGRDAVLVAPAPPSPPPSTADYSHLKRFLQTAEARVGRELFAHVGRAVLARLKSNSTPLWVSTSGLGVPWLHVRLDDAPKYYSWQEYTTSSCTRYSAAAPGGGEAGALAPGE